MFQNALRISVFAVAITGAIAQTTTPVATVETRTTGVVGIAAGQTARFNVLNAGINVSATPIACAAVLSYYDAAGAMLKSATVTVAPGTAGYLDLFSIADLSLAVDQRRQIRATFTVPLAVPVATASTAAPSTTPLGACKLIGTLEVFDAITGRSQVILGSTHLVLTELPPVPASN
jgi:hypothetical protein